MPRRKTRITKSKVSGNGPRCQFCGATTNTQFNMFGKFEFGTCCVPCEQLSDEERQQLKSSTESGVNYTS